MSACNTVIQVVPGPPGQNGTAGTNGTNGANAFTSLTAQFTMPVGGNPAGASTTATVVSTAAFFAGQIIQMQGAGYLKVSVVVNSTQMTLQNLEDFAPGLYPDNIAAGSIIAVGSILTASGPQGANGAAGTNGTNGTNGGAAFCTLTAGFVMPVGGATVVATVDATSGRAIGETVYIENCGFMQVTLISSAFLMTIMNLEVGSAYAVNVPAGTVVAAGNKVVSGGVQGPTGVTGATGAAGATGATGATSLLYALYQDSQPSGTLGYTGTIGVWTNIRLSLEMFDPSGIGVLAANSVTLQAGTYRVKWSVPGVALGTFMTRLYNATDAAPVTHTGSGLVAYGCNARSLSVDYSAISIGEARFTIASAKLIVPQIQISLNGNMGAPASFGTNEIYSSFEIWKE